MTLAFPAQCDDPACMKVARAGSPYCKAHGVSNKRPRPMLP